MSKLISLTSYMSTLCILIVSPFLNVGRLFSPTASHGIIDVNPLEVTRWPTQRKISPPEVNSTAVLQTIFPRKEDVNH